MPYPKARLAEALRIIQDDNKRRHDLEAKKLAETQYRDGFHLRRSTAVNSSNVLVWHGDDDTSDDEYAPGAKKRRRKSGLNTDLEEEEKSRKDKGKRKRKPTIPRSIDDGEDHAEEASPSKKQKNNDDEIILDPTHGFLSLKINGDAAREQFSKLAKKTSTHSTSHISDEDEDQSAEISQWRLSSGGLHRANKSATEQKRDHDVTILVSNLGLEDEEVDKKPCMLRSGKVRTPITPKKRKQQDTESESTSEAESSSKKARRTQNYNTTSINVFETPRKQLAQSRSPNIPSGKSLDDAIEIDDSSSDENTPTTSSRFSRKSNSTSTRQTSPFTWSSQTSTTILSPSKSKPQLPWRAPTTTPPTTNTSTNTNPNPTQPSTQLVLTTNFSHPINFKTTTSKTCTFHNDYRHALLGHGPKTSRYLIYTSQPSQLIKLPSDDDTPTSKSNSTGHRNTTTPPDAMCVPCALSYLQITRCDQHSFKPYIQPAHARELLAQGTTAATTAMVQDIWTRLKPSDPRRNNTVPPLEVCSLCLAQAKFRCCEPQAWDQLKRPCRLPGESVGAAVDRVNGKGKMVAAHQIQPVMLGCGLRLCGKCVVLVRDRCAGRMQENRAVVLREAHRQPLGARADIEFLFREGLVWKAYHVDRG